MVRIDLVYLICLAPLMDELFRSQTKRNYIYTANDTHTHDMIELARDSAKSFGIDLIQGAYAFWPLP